MRKKHPEHVNLERWLVSYADFITLLFAFFVIMYAISQADKAKFKTVSESLRKSLGASGGPVGMINLGGSSGGNTANVFEELSVNGGRAMDLPAGKTNVSADTDPQLQEIRDLLEESISLELGVTDPSEKVVMEFDRRGLIVRIATKNFFAQDSFEVAPDLRPILDRIARVLARSDRLIRIEGHTDISEGEDGWNLSTARATWVAKYWLKRFDFNPRRVGVAGYSHNRPLGNPYSVWGKGANRRVEFIVLNNRYEKLAE